MSPPPLGRAARSLFLLHPDGTFLNHGSYGAVPRVVADEQAALRAQMESHPDAFMARMYPDREIRAPRRVAESIAALAGTTGERIALVENATTGVQSVLNSLRLGPGDEILITSHQYNAVRLAVEARCHDTGAAPVVVALPLPASADDIVERVLAAAGPRVRLAVLDHIASSSALTLPVERLVPALRARGIRVLVDGAHAIGQLPLALDALGADWYLSNLHKWAYAPRGTALLHASAEAAPLTRPVLTSHYIGMGFPHSFDYVGTRDYTAWLAAPRALQFLHELDPARLWAHEARLIAHASQVLAAAGAEPIAPAQMHAAMRAFLLPQHRPAVDADAAAVMRTLWERERIQVRCARIGGSLLLRVCAQAYVDETDIEAVGAALARHGWPGRR